MSMETMIRFFQEGGAFMYPIALVFAVGIAIAIERYIFLTRAKVLNRQAFDALLPFIQKANTQRLSKWAIKAQRR